MASLVIPNCVQVRLLWRLSNTPWAVNVLNFTVGALTVDQTLADSIRTAVQTAYTGGVTPLRGQVHTTWSLSEIGVRDIRVANQPEYRSVLGTAAGTAGGDRLPPTMAAKVMLRTALAGKSYRGAVFVPGWAEGGNDSSGQMAGATTASSRGFVQGVGTGLAGLGLTHVVASRLHDTTQPVTTYQSLNSIWSNVRARRSGLAAF